MINDRIFAEGFKFKIFNYKKNSRTDNSSGVKTHFLAYMISGKADIIAQKEKIEVSDGEVFYIPKGLRYKSFWYGDSAVRFVSLGFEFFPIFDGIRYPLQKIQASESEKRAILRIAENGFTDTKKIGAFYSLLGTVAQRMQISTTDKKRELVFEIKRYMDLNPRENVSAIAKRFTMSESGLYSLFKNHSDTSLHEYKSRSLMNLAAELLTSNNSSVEEVSEALGFSSASYFRKCFKKFHGISPKEMRKKREI